jgi:hypothetical protein
MVQITQRRFPMIDNTIFCLFPKIDFDRLKNIKIIPYFLGAWRQPINYLWLHKADHVQSSVSVYGLCTRFRNQVSISHFIWTFEISSNRIRFIANRLISRRVATRTQKRSCVHIENFYKNENMVNLGHKVE